MLRNWCTLTVICAALTACGGGGSSNGDTSTGTLTPTGPLLSDAATDGTPVVSPTGVSLNDSAPRFTLAADGTLSVGFDAGGSLDFESGDALFVADSGVTFFANDNNRDGALVAMPDSSTLNYTAFGFWVSNASANLATVNGPFTADDAGAGHFGIATTPSAMPTSGNASYLGAAVGAISDGNEIQDLLNGTVQATANFTSGDIDLSMDLSGSNGGDFGTLTANDVPIDGGAGTFLSAAGGATLDTGHTGNISGQFYGPVAEEIGGQFDLEDGSTRVFGAFGGRQ